MVKKASFDNLPAMVGRVLEILTAEGAEQTATPEILQRVKLLERRLDNIERLLSPERPVITREKVLRILKIRPRQLVELENTGALISHREGRGTVFYEDDVVRFNLQNGWRAVLEEAEQSTPATSGEPATDETDTAVPAALAADEPAPTEATTAVTGRIDIKAACEITGRTPAAIYQLNKTKGIPCYKDGQNIYFIAEELREWVKTHPARHYKPRNRTAE